MCKILVMSGINENNRDEALQFAYNMTDYMSKGNDHGLGYAAVAEDGSIFAERWHNNSEAFTESGRKPSLAVENPEDIKAGTDEVILPVFDGFLEKTDTVFKGAPQKYDKYGNEQLGKMVALTLHTRFATSGKQFYNTHPFINEGVSLIHNGVISNVTKEDSKISTCDSERILNLYLEHNVRNNPEGIKEVAKGLRGYYACGVISKSDAGAVQIDVFKDSMARLGAVAIEKLGVVITTDPDDAVSAASEMGLQVFAKYLVKDQVLLRLDPYTGQPVLKQEFVEGEKWGSSYNYGSNWGRPVSEPVVSKKHKTSKVRPTSATVHNWFKEHEKEWVYDQEVSGYRRVKN